MVGERETDRREKGERSIVDLAESTTWPTADNMIIWGEKTKQRDPPHCIMHRKMSEDFSSVQALIQQYILDIMLFLKKKLSLPPASEILLRKSETNTMVQGVLYVWDDKNAVELYIICQQDKKKNTRSWYINQGCRFNIAVLNSVD